MKNKYLIVPWSATNRNKQPKNVQINYKVFDIIQEAIKIKQEPEEKKIVKQNEQREEIYTLVGASLFQSYL